MNMFWRAKRRLRQEIKGLKYVIGQAQSQRIIKLVYNPWYLLEIARRNIMLII